MSEEKRLSNAVSQETCSPFLLPTALVPSVGMKSFPCSKKTRAMHLKYVPIHRGPSGYQEDILQETSSRRVATRAHIKIFSFVTPFSIQSNPAERVLSTRYPADGEDKTGGREALWYLDLFCRPAGSGLEGPGDGRGRKWG